ncbi:MAG: DUF3592 domain-containing protein, partial [Candidatus Obscuribacterales bacterium]|nr:DUF3592 domain-containing protein [Candidatus Obscuribacterales bacterium]
ITSVESEKKKGSVLHDQQHELLKVHYKYDVGENCLTGNRVTLDPEEIGHLVGLFGKGNPEDKYRINEPVVIYYNPTDPSEAVLRTKTHPIVYTIFGAGAILMFFGLIGIQSRQDTP